MDNRTGRYGRDSRRRLTLNERRDLYDRADGRCQRCGELLGVDWHAAHLVAWSHGGATSLDNVEAWCPKCNLTLGANDAITPPPIVLREWQDEAITPILTQLFLDGRATLHAAPGAGKTIFAGEVFRRLYEAGFVDRILIVVPSRVIIGQWKRSLADHLGIHVDDQPHLGWRELPDTVGPIITYAGMAKAVRWHRAAISDISTFVVFDEVHHLNDKASWGAAAIKLTANSDGEQTATILNTTGTLFRTPPSPGSTAKERIPTVRYREAVDERGRDVLEAIADWSVSPVRLIGTELRPVQLQACGSTIELVDLAEGETISGEVADLPTKQLMRAAHSRMIADADWMEGFARHMLNELALQSHVLEHAEPLKALWVAKDQRRAREAVEIINRVADTDFARLVISDEPDALRTLERAIREPKPLCIVSVQMVTEGFDCAQVSTIAYANNVITELYLTQMVARAMRITRTEREKGRFLPAQVLIPDVADLRDAFRNVLAGKLDMIEALAEIEAADLGDGETGEGGLRLPRYDLTAVSIPRLDDMVVVGADRGTVTRPEVESMTEILAGLGWGDGASNVYAPSVVVAVRQFTETNVLISRVPSEITITKTNPRDINTAWRDLAQTLAGWWHHKGDTPVLHFQADANKACGIDAGGRDNATAEQMQCIVRHMQHRIRERCRQLNLRIPDIAREEDQ